MLNKKTGRVYGWPENGYPAPQGPFYCECNAGLVGKVAMWCPMQDQTQHVDLAGSRHLAGLAATLMGSFCPSWPL
jgi:hypothetical protein